MNNLHVRAVRFCGFAVATLLLLPGGIPLASAATQTLIQSVSAGTDDAEEKSTGTVSLASSDLELTTDGTNVQTVGVRFAGLGIPKDALIESAYLQFNVDEIKSAATALTIRGELPLSGSAATFNTARYNVSSRINAQSPTVAWAPPAWNTIHLAGPDQATPDIGSIVQAIVNLPNWQSGNAAAFIITGTGVRTTEAFESGAIYAVKLRVNYSIPGDVSLNSWNDLGISFNALELAVDTVGKRLFVPLGAGFQNPANYTAALQYKLADQGYVLGFAGQPPVAAGSNVDFGAIEYGSKVAVQLYKDDSIVDSYDLVFTNLIVVSLQAETIVDEPKLPGQFSLASGQFNQNIPFGPMGIEFRGQTSQQFEKKSFSIELQEADPLVER